ncbi:MAG: LysM peptidoglycan-binding domain-containing protein [Pseudomonadota bacterium]
MTAIPHDPSSTPRKTILVLIVLLLSFSLLKPVYAGEDSKTVSIHVRKTAFSDELIYEIDNKEVLALRYVVQKGDSIWKIFRKKGLWSRADSSEFLFFLREMNRSLDNLDLIHPGDTILIPLRVTNLPINSSGQEYTPVSRSSFVTSQNVEFEYYRVKPGDTLVRVAQSIHKIPKEHLYNEYLDLIKRINPTIKNFNAIYPGQTIKLPIYSPEIFRMPTGLTSSPVTAHTTKSVKPDTNMKLLADALGEILTQMGEGWIRSGDHFLPVKPRGLMKLSSKSFPVIYLQNGRTLLLDMNNSLPDRIGRLIESNWPSYRIVHLIEKDDLRSALNKVLTSSNYHKVFEKNEPLELRGDFVFKLTGDWIASLSNSSSLRGPRFVLINLTEMDIPPIPAMIVKYLERVGVRIIVYPKGYDSYVERIDDVNVMERGTDKLSLVRKILSVANVIYSSEAEIALYGSKEADSYFSLRTDFLVNINGKEAVVDLRGLEPEIASLLKERGFLHLSLVDEEEPLKVVARTLQFLRTPYSAGPHTFIIAKWDESRQITLTIQGIIFSGPKGEVVLATSTTLPIEISAYLSQKGYKILLLSTFFHP